MHEIMELKENLMNELGEYARAPKLSVEDVMVVKAMASAVDHLCNIVMAAEEEEEMYSMRGGQGGGSRYSREGGQGGSRYSREGGQGGSRYAREGGNYRYSREGGNSYAGRRGNVRRDSMGRYARTGGYSRNDGMDSLVEDIRSMMGELPQELQQEAERFVQKIEEEM